MAPGVRFCPAFIYLCRHSQSELGFEGKCSTYLPVTGLGEDTETKALRNNTSYCTYESGWLFVYYNATGELEQVMN